MISDQTTLLAVLCFLISGFLAGLVVMGTILSKRHKRELSSCRKKVQSYEEHRRKQADTIRRIGLEYVNMKRKIRILIKKHSYLGKMNLIKEIKEVINGK